MKLHPYAQRFPAFDPAMGPLFGVLDRLGRPLLVHTGFDAFYRDDLHRDDLLRVLEAYPGMPVVMVHSFFPDFGFARSLLDRFPQVWLDMTNSVSCMRLFCEFARAGQPLPDMASSLEVEVVERNLGEWEALFAGYSRRIIFGTDYPVGFGDYASLRSDLLYFGFPPETVRLLLHDNVLNLLASCGVEIEGF
jgi:predicted TIM-barrel fold metal-dependent hydrolase